MLQLTVGQRVDFIHNHPAGTAPEILTGTVQEVSVSEKHGVQYFIQPDHLYRMARWRKDHHIIAVSEIRIAA